MHNLTDTIGELQEHQSRNVNLVALSQCGGECEHHPPRDHWNKKELAGTAMVRRQPTLLAARGKVVAQHPTQDVASSLPRLASSRRDMARLLALVCAHLEPAEEEARVLAWDVAAVTAWWCHVGHAARLAVADPGSSFARVLR